MEITGAAEVRALLADPDYRVPAVPDAGKPGGIAWLRATVSRFSNGDEHARRRALACAELAQIDVGALRRATRARAREMLRAHGGEASERTALVARTVPVDVLARALGLAADVSPQVGLVARAYHPHVAPSAEADRAVASLVEAFGGACDEATAVRISLLVQACDATAGLIASARASLCAPACPASVDDALAAALRDDPPVRTTRRVKDGAVVTLALSGARDADLPFGSGPRRCPGREHALALAAGVLEAL